MLCSRYTFYAVALVIPFSIGALTCSREQPTAPVSETPELHFMVASESKYVVYTSSQLDSVLDDTLSPVLAQGDTIFLAGDSTFSMTKEYTLNNRSLYFIGGSPIPTLKRTGSGNVFLKFTELSNPGSNTIVFDNIYFESLFSGAIFIEVLNLGSAKLTDSYFDCDDDSFRLTADTVLIDNIDFDAVSGPVFEVRSRGSNSFKHTIRNSTFSLSTAFGIPQITSSLYLSAGGDLTIDNNEFSVTGADSSIFHNMNLNQFSAHNIYLDITDCDFESSVFRFADSAGDFAVVYISYDNNVSDLKLCVPDLFTCGGCGSDRYFEIDAFTYLSYENDYDTFGDSLDTNPQCVVDCDTAYIQFDVGGTELADAVVLYGANSASGDTIAAEYISGKWYTCFDVSDFTGAEFYWKPRATLCDTVQTGTANYKHFRPGNCGNAPPQWWPHMNI